MIAVLTITIVILSSFIIALIRDMKSLKDQLIALDKEQHTQNMDIIRLMKLTNELASISEEHDRAILYIVQNHIEQQTTFPYMGVVGEA